MAINLLKSLSFSKYERLLPRIFPGGVHFEIRDRQGSCLWQLDADHAGSTDADGDEDAVVAWADIGKRLQRRRMPDGQLQFRSALMSREFGQVGWLVVAFDIEESQPVTTAPEPLRRAFVDAAGFLQEEMELQAECNQLAVELTERYEELNLVYSTQDQVEYFEEGQEALVRLVHNCADYLDVGLAALICRDRQLMLHNVNSAESPQDVEVLLELLGTTVYDHVESQIRSIVLNETDDAERRRLLGGRSENLLAYPIVDDHGTAIGLIAVVARQDKHTFSNGDRNLLEVMAKKAARIIHTHHDSLTGLMNRNGFESSLVNALANARTGRVEHCLLHIDIDQLHVVNDLMGHHEGDALIRRVARLLRSLLRDTDSLGRLGGDEFGVLLGNCGVKQAHAVGDKIRNGVHKLSVVSASRQLDVSASVGIVPINAETEGIAATMAAAEIACKAAKDAGRDRVQVFEEDNTTLIRRSEEIEWIGRVQQALREDTFVLHCQPVTPLDESNEQHFEVLVRMMDDDGSILPPGEFMPAAERYQLMPLIDRWVIRNTFAALRENRAAVGDAVFCVNLSGQSLTNTGFLSFIEEEFMQSGIEPERICFEITETAAIANIDEAVAFMSRLRAMGCKFALDDFGAGLSSFGYLKMLPVDYLKIDGSFVREIKHDEVSYSMVRSICQIGRTMQLSIVAEFVGDEETQDLLRQIGVDYCQGFYIGRPVPIDRIIRELGASADAASA